MRIISLYIAIAAMLVACGPSEADKAQFAEEKRVECLDKYCEGDVVPAHDTRKEFAFKVDGQWFIGPREYGGYGGSFAFYWPSKDPVTSNSVKGQDFYGIAIEIFLRSNNIPQQGPSSYKALQIAQEQGRVLEKRRLRPGLEVWRVKDENKGLPPSLWYVATNLQDANSEPPVLHCDDQNPKFDRCTMAFRWQPGISADIRFRAKHGQDWPEIYQEVVRVLGLLRKA
jgi:hypothetical protein